MNMNCDNTSKMMTDLLSGELDATTSKELLAHIESCESCRKDYEEMKSLWIFTEKALKSAKLAESLSPDNYKAIFAAANAKPRDPWYRGLLPSFDLNMDIFDLKAVKYPLIQIAVSLALLVLLAGVLLPALSSVKYKSKSAEATANAIACQLKNNIGNSDAGLSGGGEWGLPGESKASPGQAGSGAGGGKWAEPGQSVAAPQATGAVSMLTNVEDVKVGSAQAVDSSEINVSRSESLNVPASNARNLNGSGGARKQAALKKDAPAQSQADAIDLDKAPASPAAAPVAKRDFEVDAKGKDALREDRAKNTGVYAARSSKVSVVPPPAEVSNQMLHYDSLAKSEKPREVVADKEMKERLSVKSEIEWKGAKPTSDDRLLANLTDEKGELVYRQQVLAEGDDFMNPELAVRNFEIDLKLWDMNTPADAAKFLKAKGVDIPVKRLKIIKFGVKRLLAVAAPKDQMGALEDIIDELKAREEDMRKFRDGIPLLDTKLKPVSTFSIDVDTASYTSARKLILEGRRPLPDSVRPEEFINYFDYNYKSPEGSAVVSVQLDASPSPFRPGNVSFRVGVQSRKLGPDAKKASSFTVFVDSSGSMAQRNRLDLVKSALRLLVGQLKGNDTISLISCGPEPEILLDHVPAGAGAPVERAISKLVPGGSMNLERGFIEAYRLALKNYRPGAFNRVVVFTDGIGGLGSNSAEEILRRVEMARAKGIGNTIVGVGGDGDDKLLEALANKGDGQYIFLDSEEEAQEIFADQFAAKFRELAKDVKIQVEFNPDLVARYRQVGYQNRQLSKDEFRDDKVDAGELGAGQSATALYEMQLAPAHPSVDLRQTPLAIVRIRYKLPDTLEVQEREFSITSADIKRDFSASADNFKLACAIAEFAERLRYPDTPGIANPGAIRDIVRSVIGGTYSNDSKVKEAVSLLEALK